MSWLEPSVCAHMLHLMCAHLSHLKRLQLCPTRRPAPRLGSLALRLQPRWTLDEWILEIHPGVELRANLKSMSHKCHLEVKSISHRCYLFEVAFVWELTKETIHLPLGCLQGGAV